MLSEIYKKASLLNLLKRIDADLCKQQQRKNCPFCSGHLHQSNYARKSRGITEDFLIRQSLCCGRDGCRRRALPPSCIFMGRRVYLFGIILVVMALRQNRNKGYSINRLQRLFGVSHKTIARWIKYFKEEFPASKWWRRLRGRVDCAVKNTDLPGGLLWYFIDIKRTLEEAVSECLIFLATSHAR